MICHAFLEIRKQSDCWRMMSKPAIRVFLSSVTGFLSTEHLLYKHKEVGKGGSPSPHCRQGTLKANRSICQVLAPNRPRPHLGIRIIRMYVSHRWRSGDSVPTTQDFALLHAALGWLAHCYRVKLNLKGILHRVCAAPLTRLGIHTHPSISLSLSFSDFISGPDRFPKGEKSEMETTLIGQRCGYYWLSSVALFCSTNTGERVSYSSGLTTIQLSLGRLRDAF